MGVGMWLVARFVHVNQWDLRKVHERRKKVCEIGITPDKSESVLKVYVHVNPVDPTWGSRAHKVSN